jgi:hypothetical protein
VTAALGHWSQGALHAGMPPLRAAGPALKSLAKFLPRPAALLRALDFIGYYVCDALLAVLTRAL